MTTPGSGVWPGVVYGEIRPTHRRYASGHQGTGDCQVGRRHKNHGVFGSG